MAEHVNACHGLTRVVSFMTPAFVVLASGSLSLLMQAAHGPHGQ